MSGTSDRRQFTRIAFDATAHLIDPTDNRQWQTELIDISLKGVLIKRPADWSPVTSAKYLLQLKLSPEVELQFAVRVVHEKDDRIGLNIEKLDLDSAVHLRRLVELNLGDPILLERELAELLGSD